MNKQELMKMQTCVLRVNIQCRCDGCKQKIKKLLQKIDGVYTTAVNAEQGKVTVTGNVDPNKLIKKLEKSGKHAELWGGQKGANNNFQNLLNNQFKNSQFEGGKGGGKGNKSQNKGEKGQQGQHQQQMQQFNGSKDAKVPHNKDQKSVKFNLHGVETQYVGDDDEFDEFGDEYDDESDEDEEFGHGHGHHPPNKMMPVMANFPGLRGPHGMIGVAGGAGGNDKGGGGDIDIPVISKGKDGKSVNGSRKGGGAGGDGKNRKQVGKVKKGVQSVGEFLGFGKKSKGRGDDAPGTAKIGNGSVGDGSNNTNGPKKGGGKNDGAHVINKTQKGHRDFDGLSHGGGGGGGGAKNVGHVGPMGNYARMGNNHFPAAVQALPVAAAAPAMNGGYASWYQEMGPGNPYKQQQQQQQQYMAMMMNQQQRLYGNDMFQPMMYARPYPAVNYMPPPMPPPPVADPLTHIFSDENTNSCSVM